MTKRDNINTSMNIKFKNHIVITGLLFVLSGEFLYAAEVPPRNSDPVVYSKGARLYQLNCSQCHGVNAEGGKNWRRQVDGIFPPPPLNGTGHAWHHSTDVLVRTIKQGTIKLGGRMPAWKDKLNDQEIGAILVWIQAQWPDEIYNAWYNNFYQDK